MEPTGKLVRIAKSKAAQGADTGNSSVAHESFDLGQSTILLGRAAENSIVLAEQKVSRLHAQLNWVDGDLAGGIESGWEIVDLASSNGTFVNGEKVERARIAAGDTIQLGESTLRYELGGADEADADQPIMIDSEADLEKTLIDATVSIKLSQMDVQRLRLLFFHRHDLGACRIRWLAGGRRNILRRFGDLLDDRRLVSGQGQHRITTRTVPDQRGVIREGSSFRQTCTCATRLDHRGVIGRDLCGC